MTTDKTSFGFDQVSFQEKTRKVKGVFESVASRYDLMNDVMSGGLHRLWKKTFVDRVAPFPSAACLDVAGGTGDISFRLYQKLTQHPSFGSVKGSVTVCDLTLSMVEVGRNKALDQGLIEGLSWVCGSAEALPFPDDFFDLYTISFGLRNVTHLEKALQEAYRVLKPGGRFFCLEFSKITDPVLKRLYDLYAFKIIPKMGAFIAQDEESYRYLAESIERFPEQSLLAAYLEKAHFSQVSFENLTSGLVALHSGVKLPVSGECAMPREPVPQHDPVPQNQTVFQAQTVSDSVTPSMTRTL